MISIVNGLADRAKMISACVGALGLAGCIAGWIVAPGDFFVSLSLRSLLFSWTVARRARIADDPSFNERLLGLQRPAIF